MQFAIVHCVLFVTLNLIDIESPELFSEVVYYFVPVIAASIIFGVWGFQITVRMIVPYYANLNLLKKFFSFQLVLIFCKLQPLFLGWIFSYIIDTCDGPFTITLTIRSKSLSLFLIISNIDFNFLTFFSFTVIKQVFIQVQMFMLSLWAHSLYQK